jgi:hypothetical protein
MRRPAGATSKRKRMRGQKRLFYYSRRDQTDARTKMDRAARDVLRENVEQLGKRVKR